MSMMEVVGNKTVDNGDYMMVITHSQRPLGALFGFVLGILVAVVFSFEETTMVTELTLFTILMGSLLGYLFSPGRRSMEVPKHRVLKITRKRNYVSVQVEGRRPEVVTSEPML